MVKLYTCVECGGYQVLDDDGVCRWCREKVDLRAELDRMTAAVIDGDWGPTMNERNEARAIREKYGFDE